MEYECGTCNQLYDYCSCNVLKNTPSQQLDICYYCNNPYSYCQCNNDDDLTLEKINSGIEDHKESISNSSFRVTDSSGIMKKRDLLISQIGSNDYGLSKEDATLLLMYFQWSKDSFDLKWWDNQESIRIKSGIAISKQDQLVLKSHNIPDSSKFCLICYSDEDLYALSCKHHFCSYCWTDYLKVKTEDFLVSLSSTCPQKDCPLIVPESLFFKYLKNDPKELANFQKSIFRNFISTNKALKMCTAPTCNYVIECFSLRDLEVKCLCGNTFCFACEKQTHRPITCETLVKWEQKNNSDSDDDLWVKAHCKICPHCKQSIERSSGCNYLLCDKKAGGCGKAFCYVCETDWALHSQDHFNCNKYTPDVKAKEDEASLLKEELKRLKHYFDRLTNYKAAVIMAKKMAPKIEEIQHKYISQNIPYSELKFLNEALDCVINTKNTIKNTYVFGFYLKDCTQTELFEYNQGMLEKNSDNLHKLIDVDIAKILDITGYTEFKKAFEEFKIKAVNLTSASNRFQENLNKYVETDEMQELLDFSGKRRITKLPERDVKKKR